MNKKVNKKSISSGKSTSRATKKKKSSSTAVKAKPPQKVAKKAPAGHAIDEIVRMSAEDMAHVDLARTKLALIMESVKVRDLQKEKL